MNRMVFASLFVTASLASMLAPSAFAQGGGTVGGGTGSPFTQTSIASCVVQHKDLSFAQFSWSIEADPSSPGYGDSYMDSSGNLVVSAATEPHISSYNFSVGFTITITNTSSETAGLSFGQYIQAYGEVEEEEDPDSVYATSTTELDAGVAVGGNSASATGFAPDLIDYDYQYVYSDTEEPGLATTSNVEPGGTATFTGLASGSGYGPSGPI